MKKTRAKRKPKPRPKARRPKPARQRKRGYRKLECQVGRAALMYARVKGYLSGIEKLTADKKRGVANNPNKKDWTFGAYPKPDWSRRLTGYNYKNEMNQNEIGWIAGGLGFLKPDHDVQGQIDKVLGRPPRPMYHYNKDYGRAYKRGYDSQEVGTVSKAQLIYQNWIRIAMRELQRNPHHRKYSSRCGRRHQARKYSR